MAKVEKLERLLNLIAMLLEAKAPVPFSAIRGKVIGYDDAADSSALEKRFERDKQDLRKLALNIEYVEGEAGTCGYVLRKDALLQRQTEFTPEEASVLSMAARVGEVATGGGVLGAALKSALRKLAVDLPDGELSSALNAVTTLRRNSGDPSGQEMLATFVHAATCSRRVAFRYASLKHPADPQEREVEPYGIGLMRGAWYVVGRCLRNHDVRTFKLARVESPVRFCRAEGRPDYEVPHDFAVARYLCEDGWDMGPAEPVTVHLRVPAGQGTPMMPSRARLVSTDAAGQLYELSVRSPERLVPWILARGGHVVVDSPETLRAQVRTAAERLLRGSPGESDSAGLAAAAG